ncbi:MAG: PTS transporter subunit EIIC [Malacoplasma sp.]|nr:PTS transporter subunit EIIC [Malacoplasma sp.]
MQDRLKLVPPPTAKQKNLVKVRNIFKRSFEGLGRIGKALLFPIAVLPIAAILNRLAAQIPVNDSIGNASEFVHFVQTVLAAAGNAVFNNLHILFAVGVGFGLTKDNRGEAALTALVGMILLSLLMSQGGANLPQQFYGGIHFPIDQAAVDAGIVQENATGFEALFGNKYDAILSNNVLNGIICGGFVAWLYNRFSNVELPKVLGFFSGRRLLPVLTILGMILVGIIYALIFPWIGWVLYQISLGLSNATSNRWANAAIAGVYGFFNRLLIPFGLHHIPNTFFWFVLGEHPSVTGGMVYGDINIFLNGIPAENNAGTFQSGFFPTMMFGLPALIYVFYRNAESKEQKQRVISTFVPLALISFLTGITEPIEFAFMFVSPLLYLFHALLTGVFAFITGAFGIQIGFGFSAGLFDYLLSIPKSMQIIDAKLASGTFSQVDAVFANPGWLIPIGVACAASYILVGDILVKKFNISTPGRGNNLINIDIGTEKNKNHNPEKGLSEKNKKIVLGLGGWDNIENYQNCTTRLRYDIKDMSKVNESLLKEGGAMGVKRFQDHHIQVIIGPEAELVNDEIILNKFSDLSLNTLTNKKPEKAIVEKVVAAISKPVIIKSPISGKAISLDKISDSAFSMMGKGIAIIPKSSNFVAQNNFKLENAFWTGHAFILGIDNLKFLLHIGIDTNKINQDKKAGEKLEVFESDLLSNKKEKISKGEKIVKVDFNKIKKLGYDNTTIFIVMNESIGDNEVEILVKEGQQIKQGDSLFKVKPKKN